MKGSKDFSLCRHKSKSYLSVNDGEVRILICVDTYYNFDLLPLNFKLGCHISINEGEVRNSIYVDKDK